MSKPAYTIDSTPWTAVVVCNRPGCPWRGLSHSKSSAYRQLAQHLRHGHDDRVAAAKARLRSQGVKASRHL